ncbi:MAG: peptidoglycan-binding protein [Bradyrhizobiaceae bacterium]|nr:peptidoglycan-binding protein [Bradyrhizobiaceae bacterium]
MPTLKDLAAVSITALALATSAGDLRAADAQGQFALRGFGAETCRAASQKLKGNTAASANALAWLLGYTTAFNRREPDTFDVSPLAETTAILRMVAGVCAKNPDALVETVTYDVLRSLAAARVKGNSPMAQVKSGKASAEVRRETLARMQEQLIKLGHLEGTADGNYGPRTETALKAFQRQQGLAQTGVPDSVTIVRLLVEMPAAKSQ